jgi:hypothetical protein
MRAWSLYFFKPVFKYRNLFRDYFFYFYPESHLL